MAKARNKVIEGKFKNESIIIGLNDTVEVQYDFFKTYKLNEDNVNKIELLSAEQSKDIGSSVARGLVGGLLLGPVGLVAGAMVGKQSNINMFNIYYKNGEKSFIEVDKKISDCLLSLKWRLENK